MNTEDKGGRTKGKKGGIEAIERYEDTRGHDNTRVHGNIEQRGNREERMIIERKKRRRRNSRGVSRDMNETLRKERRERGKKGAYKTLGILGIGSHNV